MQVRPAFSPEPCEERRVCTGPDMQPSTMEREPVRPDHSNTTEFNGAVSSPKKSTGDDVTQKKRSDDAKQDRRKEKKMRLEGEVMMRRDRDDG